MSLRSDFGSVSEKRVPKSAKYRDVQSTLDTGASASKRPPAMPAAVLAQRRNEEFKRIKPSTLARMIEEHQEDGFESVFNHVETCDEGASRSSMKPSISMNNKSHAAGSVASVAGSVVSVIQSDVGLAESRNLVLLDLREPEEYEKCRLPFAISYPAPKINRDQIIPELYACKRDKSKLLVIYHTNDATTAGIAALLVQKGWESVYALSGGFEEMVSSYPEVLDGELPQRTMRPNTSSTVRSGSGGSIQSAPRMPGEIRRGNSIPRRTNSSSGRSASPSSVSGSVRSSGMRANSVQSSGRIRA